MQVKKSEVAPMVLISSFLLTASEEQVAKVCDFVVALEQDKVIRSKSDDGWLTYVFLERKNGQ